MRDVEVGRRYHVRMPTWIKRENTKVSQVVIPSRSIVRLLSVTTGKFPWEITFRFRVEKQPLDTYMETNMVGEEIYLTCDHTWFFDHFGWIADGQESCYGIPVDPAPTL